MANSNITQVAQVKIGNYTLPVCSEYKGSLSDLDVDTGRSVNDGILIRNRKRKGIYKLEFKYDLLTVDVAREILNHIEPVFFNVNFYAVDKGERITRQMYVGDRSFEWTLAVPLGKTEPELCITELSFNFIEK